MDQAEDRLRQYGPNDSQAAISRAKPVAPPWVVNSYASCGVTTSLYPTPPVAANRLAVNVSMARS